MISRLIGRFRGRLRCGAAGAPATVNARWLMSGAINVGVTLVGISVFSGIVLAQPTGSSFCTTALAETLKNIFSVIQFGGPLIGGVVALGSAVALSFVRRSDYKRELKELRNQGLIWGVVVAPLGTVIIQFILNTVVAGGASCTF
jgi:hypothetical protein